MRLTTIALLFILVVGCAARESTYRSGVLTVAVIGSDVYAGRAQTDGNSGTFKLVSLDKAQTECTGHFRYNLPPNGTARFRCSNGDSGTLRLKAEGNLVGSGRGKSSRGPIELVFGYSLRQINRRLDLPPGTELVWYQTDLLLVEVSEKEQP